MRRLAAVFLVTTMGVSTALSAPESAKKEASIELEGVKAIAASSINPPDPVSACSEAKEDAKAKAKTAGFPGRIEWTRLSTDSDCSLTTPGKTGVGYFFIFKAKGTFFKT